MTPAGRTAVGASELHGARKSTVLRWPRRDKHEAAVARAEGLCARGLKQHQAGRLAPAVELFREAVATCPTLFEARVNLASALYQLALARGEGSAAQLAEAATQCEYVLGLDPDHAAAALDLAAIRNAQGDHAEALRLLQDLARARPHQRDVHYNLAVAWLRTGYPDRARQEAVAELEESPDHVLARQLVERLAPPREPF